MHFFPAPAGFYRVFHPVITAKIVRFPFEGDLCGPLSCFLVLVNTGAAALIAGYALSLRGFQDRNRSTLAQLQVLPDDACLQAPAAFGFSVLQQGLAYNCFLSAVTAAFPAVHAIFFPGITDHRKMMKPFSNIVFARRPAPAAAALFIAGGQLFSRCRTFTAAVTDAFPNSAAAEHPVLSRFHANQPAKPLSGQIRLTGFHPGDAAAVQNGFPLQAAGIQ